MITKLSFFLQIQLGEAKHYSKVLKVPQLFVTSVGLPSQHRFEQKWLPGKAWELIANRYIRGEGSIAIREECGGGNGEVGGFQNNGV